MKTYLSILFCSMCITFSYTQDILPKDSKVEFKIKGGGIFNVKGSFKGMKGDFRFTPESLENSAFNICIDASTVNTGNDKRDAHLKNPDFFEVSTYPNICFKSTSVTKTNKGYSTTGNLSMHGVSKTVSIPFTFKNNTFKGQLTINRFHYNIGNDIGTFKVGEEAEVTIICAVKD
ncbi:YceI family protein [Mangrovimonas spongiae]|uniref:YceI family protein n=1 Tax=Mangrovimonas spongiae TaxID=2494697 RepID=A0A428K6R9_9FLAO|nr:YceI family protein [Mangrovimonas spongiae]RSK42115.1 YceI family protein [Mangrovimonas spongiae]